MLETTVIVTVAITSIVIAMGSLLGVVAWVSYMAEEKRWEKEDE